jgi:hypothetical protein
MLIFATSDKGGTGRSVTSCNIAYRKALQGADICYMDFDFGSPTAGVVFNISSVIRGDVTGGLHSYLRGSVPEPMRIDAWSESDRDSLRRRPPGAGKLILVPGDSGGGEFPTDPEMVHRCARLLLRMDEEFELTIVDLSAGRSYATEIALAATAEPAMHGVTARWLVFHRWTRQHILATNGLVYGKRGLLEIGSRFGHDNEELARSIRFVRTAVVDPNSPELAGLRPTQVAWLEKTHHELQELASQNRVGRTATLGDVPLDPVLQWREQLISDNDVWSRKVANEETVEAFDRLAKLLTDDAAWRGL